MDRHRSEAIYEKACAVIPGGVSSTVRAFKAVGVSPLVAEAASGALLRDADGYEYIDYFCGSGALVLGHAHPQIIRAAKEQIEKGIFFWVSTEIEQKFGCKLTQLIPSVEKIRFVVSGTEATLVALRLARGFTERPKIVKFAGHYHGHSDSLLVQAGSGVASINPIATSKGIPLSVIAETLVLPFNDFNAVRSFFRTSPMIEQVAAVIVEPIAGNMGVVPPEPEFLKMLREETERTGALLIFDEIITGFRVGLMGAQGLYGITPDITCLGKIIGGGFPIAAVGGRAEILDQLSPLGQVYQAGTLAGNPVAARVGFETLCLLEEEKFYEKLEEKANQITGPVRQALEKKGANACLNQVGSMFSLFFGARKVQSKTPLDEELFARFFRYLLGRGIFIPPSPHEAWFVSHAHTEEQLKMTAECICSFIEDHL